MEKKTDRQSGQKTEIQKYRIRYSVFLFFCFTRSCKTEKQKNRIFCFSVFLKIRKTEKQNPIFCFSVLQDPVKQKNEIFCFSVLQDSVKQKNRKCVNIWCFRFSVFQKNRRNPKPSFSYPLVF